MQRKLEVCFDERNQFSFELKLMNNYERATRVLKNLSTREVDGRFFVPNRRAYAQAVVECSTLSRKRITYNQIAKSGGQIALHNFYIIECNILKNFNSKKIKKE